MVVKYHLVVARQSAGAQPARPRPRSPLPAPRCRPRRPPPAAPSSCPGSGSDPGTAASSMSGALLLRVPHRPEDSPAENGQRRRVGCLLASLGGCSSPPGPLLYKHRGQRRGPNAQSKASVLCTARKGSLLRAAVGCSVARFYADSLKIY